MRSAHWTLRLQPSSRFRACLPKKVIDAELHHIEGCERDQSKLLSARVDYYMHAENSLRFIDAFVDVLDLAAAGFGRVRPKTQFP